MCVTMEFVSSENICKSQLIKRANILTLFTIDWNHKINPLMPGGNKKVTHT